MSAAEDARLALVRRAASILHRAARQASHDTYLDGYTLQGRVHEALCEVLNLRVSFENELVRHEEPAYQLWIRLFDAANRLVKVTDEVFWANVDIYGAPEFAQEFGLDESLGERFTKMSIKGPQPMEEDKAMD